MSSREDIDNGSLVYTCNCGWIDTRHANPNSTRPYIGAVELWNQILYETGKKSKNPSEDGFYVKYTQDMGMRLPIVGTVRADETGEFFVESGLSRAEKESVALGIFRMVSYNFENMQDSFPYNIVTDSGFSEEDLVSDLIGFYKAIRPGTDYMSLCQPVSKKASREVWDKYGSVEKSKNKTFSPVYHPCKECLPSTQFPAELQAIKPAVLGLKFRYWTTEDE